MRSSRHQLASIPERVGTHLASTAIADKDKLEGRDRARIRLGRHFVRGCVAERK